MEHSIIEINYALFISDKPTLVDWGGHMVDHARAEEDAWPRLLQFLHKHLDGPKSRL